VGNLPADLTSFIGRRREIAEVRKQLSASRLVTLIGVGGVGKTRLAMQVGAQSVRAFRDGVWLVELAALADGGLLTQTVAAALGMRDQSAREPHDQLSAYLAERQLMVVLDNCEHLVDECAGFVDRLLRVAPRLRFLATSRQPLGIGGEQIIVVPPLSAPDTGDALPVEALARYDAVTLFVERAAAVQPGFCVTTENRASVARLCAQLDGLPLAIELAAARLRSLSAQQVAERLENRFRLLTGGSRAALPRQQTLQALIDWSFELCSAEERLLWSRLSVFASGFDLSAAEAVCAGDDLPPDAILDHVDHLVAKSVLIAEEHDGGKRYRLLDTIRQYGRERLAERGGDAGLRRRHRDFYLRIAEQSVSEWCGPWQARWLTRLRAEHANMRSALDFCIGDPHEAQVGLRLAAVLRFHWVMGGFLSEGRHWLDQALELGSEPTPHRAEALWVAAWVALLQGDMREATRRLTECRQLAEQLGDPLVGAEVARFSGLAAVFRGDNEGALPLLETAIGVLESVGDADAVILTLYHVAVAASLLGDSDRARAACERAIGISDACGERWARSWVLWGLALDGWLRGDLVSATGLARESLTIKAEFDDLLGTALSIELLAWIAASRGQFEHAARLLGAAGAIWHSLGTSIAAFGPQRAGFHDDGERRILRSLSERAYRAAAAEGARLTVDQAIAHALEDRRASSRAPAAADEPLTKRQLEIASLVAEGMSNRQIAERLVVSLRTVDGHVEQILARMGFARRAQIAAWVAEQRSVAGAAQPSASARSGRPT
jgi:predicted ATPase/DNA-binding CsgD family transcriptional regulator